MLGKFMDWLSVILAGVGGGVAMELSAVLLNLVGFKCASMVSYEGCMITGKTSGITSYLAGLTMHLILSVLIAFVYAWAFQMIWGAAYWLYGSILAVPHWIIGGLVVPLMDKFSSCVKNGTVEPLKLFASGNLTFFITFLIGHLVYGAVVGWFLSRAFP
jgi:hypothetical protein